MKRLEYRRKREGKTNYKKRLNLLKSGKLRLIINRSLKNINLQVAQYHEDGDKILVSANSKELEKNYDWKASRTNLPASYLTGYLLGKRAIKKNIKEAILDIGLRSNIKESRLYSALKGVIDAGVKVEHSDEIFPNEDRIKGNSIVNYAKKLSSDGKYEKVFSTYQKKGIKAEDIPSMLEEIKKKID